MPITFWRRLSTPVKQLIIVLILVILLFAFLIPFSMMVTRRVQACLDSELYHQGLALRSWFTDELYYLREEARLLAESESIEDLIASHDDKQLRRLMGLYQNAHEADAIYLITNSNEIYTSALSPPLDPETVRELALVEMGFHGQVFAEMLTVENRIWLMSVAPHRSNDSAIDAVFLIIREVDSGFLERLVGSLNEVIVLTDGNVVVQSHAGYVPEQVLNSLTQTVRGRVDEHLQPYTVRFNGMSYRALTLPLMSSHTGTYAIALVKNAEIVANTMWVTLRGGAIFGFIGIIIALLLVQFHVVEIFRPLRALVKSTQRIAAGQLDEPLEPTGVAEVYELATNFEIMRARLKELLDRERSLSENLEVEILEKSVALEEMCRSREQLMAQLISTQEEERRRISRELHDETSQELANIIVRLGTLARMVEDDEILEKLQELRTEAVRALEGVNRIVMNLRPGFLDEYGLVPAVQWYANARLEPQGVQVKMKVTGAPRELSPYAQASIYRMVQEAINNIYQHAQAKNVSIRFDWLPDALRIEIQDDGRGFDLDEALKTEGHYGLLGIQERVTLLNGTLKIQSSPGHGTHLIIHIPYILNTARNNDSN